MDRLNVAFFTICTAYFSHVYRPLNFIKCGLLTLEIRNMWHMNRLSSSVYIILYKC